MKCNMLNLCSMKGVLGMVQVSFTLRRWHIGFLGITDQKWPFEGPKTSLQADFYAKSSS